MDTDNQVYCCQTGEDLMEAHRRYMGLLSACRYKGLSPDEESLHICGVANAARLNYKGLGRVLAHINTTTDHNHFQHSDGVGREPMVTDKQLAAIYAIAKSRSLDAQLECFAWMKCEPEQLSQTQASAFINRLKRNQMTIKDIRAAMLQRNISLVEIQKRSGYSASFVSQIMNSSDTDESRLPGRIRRALEGVGILDPQNCAPTPRQLDYLKDLGFKGTVRSRDEASQMIDQLKSQRAY